MLPFALQHEGAQPFGIVAIGVDRLDRGQEGAVGQAIAKGQPAFRRMDDIVLAQIGDGLGKRRVKVQSAFVGQGKDHRCGCDHLGHRCEIEPVRAGQRLGCRVARSQPRQPDRAAAIGGDHPQRRAGDPSRANRLAGGGKGGLDQCVDHDAGSSPGWSDGRATARPMTGRNRIAARLSPPESRKKPS
jgi:hypothetical protein